MTWTRVEDALPEENCECWTFGIYGIWRGNYFVTERKFQDASETENGWLPGVREWMPIEKPKRTYEL